jgi:hypothetical protein
MNRGRVSDPAQAALSGSHRKAPGSAEGYLLLRTSGFFGIAAKSYGSVSLYAKKTENLSVSMSIEAFIIRYSILIARLQPLSKIAS